MWDWDSRPAGAYCARRPARGRDERAVASKIIGGRCVCAHPTASNGPSPARREIGDKPEHIRSLPKVDNVWGKKAVYGFCTVSGGENCGRPRTHAPRRARGAAPGMDFDGVSSKGKVDAVVRARAAREERQRVSANLSEQHKAAVAGKLQAGARRFLGVLRSRALLRAEWRCPPSPSNGQQLVICLWLLRFFDPVHDGVALCTLCRVVVAGMRPALGAPPGVPLRTHPCVNQEWSRTSRP